MFQASKFLSSPSTGLAIAMAALLTACGGGGGNSDSAEGGTLENPNPPTSADWEMVWSDEFDGSAVDTGNWDIQLGDGVTYVAHTDFITAIADGNGGALRSFHVGIEETASRGDVFAAHVVVVPVGGKSRSFNRNEDVWVKSFKVVICLLTRRSQIVS